MLENDIIERSVSSWSPPYLLVPKLDCPYRFFTDFRKVNKLTSTDSYPISQIDTCTDTVGHASYVNKFRSAERLLAVATLR